MINEGEGESKERRRRGRIKGRRKGRKKEIKKNGGKRKGNENEESLCRKEDKCTFSLVRAKKAKGKQ